MAVFAASPPSSNSTPLIQLSANELNSLIEKCKKALKSFNLETNQNLGNKLTSAQITDSDLSCSAKKGLLLAQQLAPYIDHTLLKADAKPAEIQKLCTEARHFGFATVCVNSRYIRLATHELKDSKTLPISVVGFPLGACDTQAKSHEAKLSIHHGAQEIDMVLALGALKSGDWGAVFEDIATVVQSSKPYPVKVILETSLLTDAEKVVACVISKEAGAAFVKTSTGFSTGGATEHDIALMRSVVGADMGVKASGGIRTTADALKMIAAGANRIGASASVQIIGADGSGLKSDGY